MQFQILIGGIYMRFLKTFLFFIGCFTLFSLQADCNDLIRSREFCSPCCSKLSKSNCKAKKGCVTIPARTQFFTQFGDCAQIEENVPEAKIYVRIQGKLHCDKPTIVFIHGFGGSSDGWKCAQEELSSHYCTVAMDLRGYGRSSKTPPSPEPGGVHYNLQLNSDDIFVLLNHFGITKNIILVAHSLGGNIALKYVSQHQDQLLKLVLVSSVAFLTPECNCTNPCFNPYTCENDFCYPFGITAEQDAGLGALLTDCLNSGGTNESCQIVSSLWYNESCQDLLVKPKEALIDSFVTNTLPIIFNQNQNLLREEFRSFLPGIAIPTLLCFGSKDLIVNSLNSQFLHANIPNSALAEFVGVGHQLHVTDYKNFNRLLKAFIQSCELPDFIKVFDQGCCVCPLVKPEDFAAQACQ